jgi:hypothetical protein
MSTKKRPLKASEIEEAFARDGKAVPFVVSPPKLAEILGLSPKTIYDWIGKGRLEGTLRKRGNHDLILLSRALLAIFNGPEWSTKPNE